MTVRTDRGNEVIDGGQRGPNASRLVHRPTATLRPHPTYQACGGPIAATRVCRVAQQRGAIREPLLTTTAGTILDGHARWQVALDRQQPTLPCIEYDLTEEEALQFVIERHRMSEGLNDFCRIVLGLTSGTLLQRLTPDRSSRSWRCLERRGIVTTRPAAREAFTEVVDCGTEALGAEVFLAGDEEWSSITPVNHGPVPHSCITSREELRHDEGVNRDAAFLG